MLTPRCIVGEVSSSKELKASVSYPQGDIRFRSFILKGIERRVHSPETHASHLKCVSSSKELKGHGPPLYPRLPSCFILKGIESVHSPETHASRLKCVSSSKELKAFLIRIRAYMPTKMVSSSKELKVPGVGGRFYSNSRFILKGIESFRMH